MSVVDVPINEARRMSEYMIAKKFRGPGDTIEWAAYEAERTWGAPASIMLRLRHRDVSDMKLSSWIRIVGAALAAGYISTCEAVERAADAEEGRTRAGGANEANSSLFAMGVALGRPKDEPAKVAARRANGGAE